jgi:hypothetical protein
VSFGPKHERKHAACPSNPCPLCIGTSSCTADRYAHPPQPSTVKTAQLTLNNPDAPPPRYPNLEATGYLTRAQVEVLWNFQRKTGARSVKFGAWPTVRLQFLTALP